MMTEQENKYFQEGRRLFKLGHYYQAHEEWEQVWLHRKTDDRQFFQGLILVAGAFCHIKKKKFRPAWVALTKASQKLNSYQSNYLGVDVAALYELIQKNIELLQTQQWEWLIWPHEGHFA